MARTPVLHAPDVTQTDTTDPEDIRALAVAVVDLVKGSPAYDDMTWAEVSAALALALAQIKTNWIYSGSVKGELPPPPAP
jgi:hypothetical protein